MTLLDSLQSHTEACEEMYRLMLELNRVLKAGTATPDADLLERKRAALITLETSLVELKMNGAHGNTVSAEQRNAMEKCQRTILKAMLLDRENEQLLLKNAMVRPKVPTAAKPAPGHLAKVYGKFS